MLAPIDVIRAYPLHDLAAIKIPRYVAFVDSLPMTATQRVRKFRLRGDQALLAKAVDLGD